MKCPECGTNIPQYKNPVPTVDVIITFEGGIVLIERKNPPFGWALPGGFVDYGESFEQAAHREAREETSLRLEGLEQFRTYSDPTRDARLHTATTVYLAQGVGVLQAADDAKAAAVFRAADLPPLVFDHQQILADYFQAYAD